MANWKTPRPLGNHYEIDKRKRPNFLYASHVSELNKLVERINENKLANRSVPWFDPAGAGINAKVLLLLQDPSNIAKEGTGFISPDNPDATADNTTYFRNQANLKPDELVHWNIVPWQINDKNAHDEISKAKPYFEEFVKLLPKLRVVVCMGIIAKDGWDLSYPQNKCMNGWLPVLQNTSSSIIALYCPHPSPQSLGGKHATELVDGFTPSERIQKTLSSVRTILDNK